MPLGFFIAVRRAELVIGRRVEIFDQRTVLPIEMIVVGERAIDCRKCFDLVAELQFDRRSVERLVRLKHHSTTPRRVSRDQLPKIFYVERLDFFRNAVAIFIPILLAATRNQKNPAAEHHSQKFPPIHFTALPFVNSQIVRISEIGLSSRVFL